MAYYKGEIPTSKQIEDLKEKHFPKTKEDSIQKLMDRECLDYILQIPEEYAKATRDYIFALEQEVMRLSKFESKINKIEEALGHRLPEDDLPF